MILELLALGGFGWLFDQVTSTEVAVGYRCKLCDWHTPYGDPRTFQYDIEAKEDANALFKMHVKDAHPAVYSELYPHVMEDL